MFIDVLLKAAHSQLLSRAVHVSEFTSLCDVGLRFEENADFGIRIYCDTGRECKDLWVITSNNL